MSTMCTSGKYIFVSYSHDDKDTVWPIIKKMESRGLRIWFDDKIPVGSYWDDVIKQKVVDCEVFLLFISPYYFSSEYCRKEIDIAKKGNKKFLIIYLTETTLPHDLAYLSSIHSIKCNQYSFKEKFYDKILNSAILDDCYLNRYELLSFFGKDIKDMIVDYKDASLLSSIHDAESEKEARHIIFENHYFDDTFDEPDDISSWEEGLVNQVITDIQTGKYGKKERLLNTLLALFVYIKLVLLLNYQRIGLPLEFDSQKYVLQNFVGFGIGFAIALLLLLLAFVHKKRYFYKVLHSPMLFLSIANLFYGAFFSNITSLIICQYIAIHFTGLAEIGMIFSARELKKIEAKDRRNFKSETASVAKSRQLLSILIYLNTFIFLVLYVLMILSHP